MSLPPSAPVLPPGWVLPVVLAVGAVLAGPVFPLGFLADDFAYIARFRELPWGAWPGLFVADWSGGIWGERLKELRPFAALSFMVDARLWGGHAAGHRLTNVVLHLTTLALVMHLAWRYGQGRARAAWIAGLAFAVHPAQVGTVAWITGRADLLGTCAALAFLAAGEAYAAGGRRRAAAAGLGAFGVGVFTKEFCLILPLLLALRWVLLDPRAGAAVWRRRVVLLAGVLALVALYAGARRVAFGPDPTTGFFGWNDGPAWARQAAYWGWLFPVLPFTTGGEWAGVPGFGVLRAGWSALAAGVVLALVAGRGRGWLPAVFFGGFWWFATTLGLFVVVYFSPRHLYLPLAGVAVGAGLALAAGRVRAVVAAGVLAWALAAQLAVWPAWREAGRISREVTAVVREHFPAGDDTTLLLVSAPEQWGPVLLWAWASPQAFGAPFLDRPVPPGRILERVGMYARPDRWGAERRPVESLRRAGGALAVHVEAGGRVRHRLLSRAELQPLGDRLEELAARGLNAENFAAWLESCAAP